MDSFNKEEFSQLIRNQQKKLEPFEFTVITGAKLKELTNQTKFYKMINNHAYHYDFQYKIGKNTDINELSPIDSCTSGGLYFTTFQFLGFFMSFGNTIATVEIDDDEDIYIEQKKFKCKSFTITNVRNIRLEEYKYFLCTDGLLLKHMSSHEKTPEICEIAVCSNGAALQYVPHWLQTDEILEMAVKSSGFAIYFVQKLRINDNLLSMANQYFIEYIKYDPFMYIRDEFMTDELKQIKQNEFLEYIKKNPTHIHKIPIKYRIQKIIDNASLTFWQKLTLSR